MFVVATPRGGETPEEDASITRLFDPTMVRERIALAAGLLAILLALAPAYDFLASQTIQLEGLAVSLSFGYIVLGVILAFCVYCYGFAVLSGAFSFFQRLGDFFYLVAFLWPSAFLLSFLLWGFATFLSFDPQGEQIAGWILGVLVYGAAIWLLLVLYKQTGRRDAARKAEVVEERGRALERNALRLFDSKFFGPAVVEAANALIVTAESQMPTPSRRPIKVLDVYLWLQTQAELDIPNLADHLARIRHWRNQLAHGRETISEREAGALISHVSTILVALRDRQTAVFSSAADPLPKNLDAS